jgi:hypothetical protein
MSGIEVVAAMVILFAFAIGIVIGVVAIVSVASRREDRLYSLWGEAPDAACRGARRLVGVWVRGGRPDRRFRGLDEDDGAVGQESLR